MCTSFPPSPHPFPVFPLCLQWVEYGTSFAFHQSGTLSDAYSTDQCSFLRYDCQTNPIQNDTSIIDIESSGSLQCYTRFKSKGLCAGSMHSSN